MNRMVVALMAELGAMLGNPRARLVAVERSVFRRRVAPADDLIVGAQRTRAASGGFGVRLASRVTLAPRQDGTA